jgi:hypothetical protein
MWRTTFLATVISSSLLYTGIALAEDAAPGAVAPPQTITFTVTLQEAQVILNQVGQAPWKDSAALMQKLIQQANDQTKPKGDKKSDQPPHKAE